MVGLIFIKKNSNHIGLEVENRFYRPYIMEICKFTAMAGKLFWKTAEIIQPLIILWNELVTTSVTIRSAFTARKGCEYVVLVHCSYLNELSTFPWLVAWFTCYLFMCIISWREKTTEANYVNVIDLVGNVSRDRYDLIRIFRV